MAKKTRLDSPDSKEPKWTNRKSTNKIAKDSFKADIKEVSLAYIKSFFKKKNLIQFLSCASNNRNFAKNEEILDLIEYLGCGKWYSNFYYLK